MAAPFAVVLAIGLQVAREPRFDVQFSVAGERTVEGAGVDAELVVRAESAVDRLELLLDLPQGVESRKTMLCRSAARRRGAHDLDALSSARAGASTTWGWSRPAPVTRSGSWSGRSAFSGSVS